MYSHRRYELSGYGSNPERPDALLIGRAGWVFVCSYVLVMIMIVLSSEMSVVYTEKKGSCQSPPRTFGSLVPSSCVVTIAASTQQDLLIVMPLTASVLFPRLRRSRRTSPASRSAIFRGPRVASQREYRTLGGGLGESDSPKRTSRMGLNTQMNRTPDRV